MIALSHVRPKFAGQSLLSRLVQSGTAHALNLLPPTRSQGHWIDRVISHALRQSAFRFSLVTWSSCHSEYVLPASSRGPEILILCFENMILFTLFYLFNSIILLLMRYSYVFLSFLFIFDILVFNKLNRSYLNGSHNVDYRKSSLYSCIYIEMIVIQNASHHIIYDDIEPNIVFLFSVSIYMNKRTITTRVLGIS